MGVAPQSSDGEGTNMSAGMVTIKKASPAKPVGGLQSSWPEAKDNMSASKDSDLVLQS